ncbi:amidase [Labrys wisconsinensis]|uniref:Indoleacetamide hydrolase n=1 Tax=Labrys wisconsinensis TaxID=425677 RepID=A0ABU0J3Y2_9HYPH|nr:amidase [Labrys wisconsinensis]MDQ0468982.1 Asp-tRNA(Asn)/Glu-tRNA(Gln) amidotransferase A subunit family amidase [Labrys wisconsinensis]
MTHPLTATAIAAAVRSGGLSARLAVEVALARIGTVQPALNCFTEVYGEEALVQAATIDALPLDRRAGLALCGVPIAIKDFTPIAGKRTTFGSKVFRDHVADADPVIVRRLKAAGAIVVGHTTTPEFAYSGYTHSPLWGITRNPWNMGRTPGGSSGGSGAAVAAGCVPLAEGTDMGGSVRIPGSLCGIVGMKPSFGRIPLDISRTQYDSLAHFGPLARTVDDAALFLSVTAGPDDADVFSLPSAPSVLPLPSLEAPRLAVSPDLDVYATSPAVAALFEATVEALAAAGARIERVRTPFTRGHIEDQDALWAYCFAGDFGHLLEEHEAELDPGVVRLIRAGRRLDAVALRAIEHRRTALWRAFAPLVAGYDALLCPTTCDTARPVEAFDDPSVTMPDGRLYTQSMTEPFNLVSACPVVSVPMGLAADGLPAGMQVVARRHDDARALAVAKWIEGVRPWSFPTGLGEAAPVS